MLDTKILPSPIWPVWAAVVIAASLVAVFVYVGMSLGKVTSMHNNPAVLSTFSILSSLGVMAAGALVVWTIRPTHIAGCRYAPESGAAE